MFDLSEEDGRTIVLIRAYEKCRQEAGQSGYRCLKQDGDKLEASPQIWKSFQTVLKFLLSKGFRVTWKEAAWVGYVKYVFASLKPTVPQPGQLKNELLLKNYLRMVPVDDDLPPPEPLRSDEDLEALYKRVVVHPISSDDHTMAVLGLRRV